MGFLEGFFMIGVLAGNVLFSLFIDDHNPKSTHWLNVYWVLGVLSSLSFIFLFFSKLNEKEAKSGTTDLIGDIKNSISLFSYKKFYSFFFVLSCLFWWSKVSRPGRRLSIKRY